MIPVFRLRLLCGVIGLFFLTGCSLNEGNVSQTVASQVAAAVSETVAAHPTATAYPTLTPVATYTPLATAVVPDTATPYPTYTPYPTFTPEPTATEEPTAEPTSQANVTPTTAQISVTTAPASVTATPAVDSQAQLLAAMESVLRDIETAQYSLRPLQMNPNDPNAATILPTDCAALMTHYDRMANGLILTPETLSPELQNAYQSYRTGLETILSILEPRVTDCRTLVASGSNGNTMGNSEYFAVIEILAAPISLLNQAANALRQG
jgi:hypothetical protein